MTYLPRSNIPKQTQTHSTAPWCGHCKALAPEYEKAANTLLSHSSKVALINVDATMEEDLAEKYDVRGFPNLKWFRRGQASEYTGGRTELEIVEWVKQKTGPATTALKTRDAVEDFAEAYEVAVVAFIDQNPADTRFAAFETVAYNNVNGDVHFGVAAPSLAADFLDGDVADTSVVLFKKFDEGKVPFVGNDYALLGDFVATHSMPLVFPFTEEMAPKIFGGDNKKHFLAFCDADNEPEIMEALRNAAKAYRGDMLFITIGKESSRIVDFFGVAESEFPTARLVVMGDAQLVKYRFEGPEGAPLSLSKLADVSAFIGRFKAGRLSPDMKSEEPPSPNDGPVTIVVGKNFNEVVLGDKDVLIQFYAPWCGHCKRLAPVWQELGIAMKDVPTVTIAKMDVTANEHLAVDVTGFPTIMMWPADSGAEDGVAFEGVREMHAFLEFLTEHAAHAFEPPRTNLDEL